MKSKNSITAEEKNLLDYLYEKANDIADYCHRNGIKTMLNITVQADCKGGNVTFDRRDVHFTEFYESRNVKRIVGQHYNHASDRVDLTEWEYEDKEDE